MSGYRNPVIIHQTAPSISSGYTASSSSGSYASYDSSTPRSMSPSDEVSLRVYGADKHTSSMRNGRNVTVVNRNQPGYEYGAPSPSYGSSFARRTQ
ncbi:hypothetical protein CkaCkLH20_05759 [Colletotrichum karsti]|uniref:Uncharacterized protein n=1 Tax=Colletotrichum karsti TaxID=1095194 RepID=A0A9P6LKM6_9PEZI|nr:uncharacterized protein CkaCkLH20_05759 [Colletotrichum karsti]KAF9876913.1 hypothetical protein CkaCkLH20_05759 [Colletotrichum karsti]